MDVAYPWRSHCIYLLRALHTVCPRLIHTANECIANFAKFLYILVDFVLIEKIELNDALIIRMFYVLFSFLFYCLFYGLTA